MGARIDALRARWDPRMAARIESHISVIYEMTGLAQLRRAVAATRPLRVRLTEARRWTTDAGGIFVGVEDPYGDLKKFREAALGAAAEPYAPHVTILHRDSVGSVAQVDEAWAALEGTKLDAPFTVRELVVYEELDAAWHSAARLRFGDDSLGEVLREERIR